MLLGGGWPCSSVSNERWRGNLEGGKDPRLPFVSMNGEIKRSEILNRTVFPNIFVVLGTLINYKENSWHSKTV